MREHAIRFFRFRSPPAATPRRRRRAIRQGGPWGTSSRPLVAPHLGDRIMAGSERPTTAMSCDHQATRPLDKEARAAEGHRADPRAEVPVAPAGPEDGAAGGASANGPREHASALAASARWILDARAVIADCRELGHRMADEECQELEEMVEDLEDAITFQEEVAAAAVLTEIEDLIRHV